LNETANEQKKCMFGIIIWQNHNVTDFASLSETANCNFCKNHSSTLILPKLTNNPNMFNFWNIFLRLDIQLRDRLIRGTPIPLSTGKGPFKVKSFSMYELAQHRKWHWEDSSLRPWDNHFQNLFYHFDAWSSYI
jgi:hypothetical protein